MRPWPYFAGMLDAMEEINAILLKNALESRRDAAETVEMWLELKRVMRQLDVMTKDHTDSPYIKGYVEACRKFADKFLEDGTTTTD